jgi:hypothetical protein
MLLATTIALGACGSSSPTAASSTSSPATATTIPKIKGYDATGKITYKIVAGSVRFDSATKIYTVPVLVGNTGNHATAPWCTAIINSSPGSAIGIAPVRRVGSIGAGTSATVAVKVKLTVSGTATQVQAICAPSRSAAANSTNWNDAKVALPATTTTSAPASNFSVTEACTAVQNLAADVNSWISNNKAPARLAADSKAFVKYVLVPGGNARLIAQAGTLINDLKTAQKSGNLNATHNTLVKMDTTCLGLEA